VNYLWRSRHRLTGADQDRRRGTGDVEVEAVEQADDAAFDETRLTRGIGEGVVLESIEEQRGVAVAV
jgi:hypothetical protein